MRWPHNFPRPCEIIVEAMCQWVGFLCSVILICALRAVAP